MKATARESADLKMALKHDPVSPVLMTEAEAFPIEVDESVAEVVGGFDSCDPESWVAAYLASDPSGSASSPQPERGVSNPKGADVS